MSVTIRNVCAGILGAAIAATPSVQAAQPAQASAKRKTITCG